MKAEFEAVLRSEAVARLPIDAFVRALTVNRGRQIALLLGAGASLSSVVPSAQRCVWEWKRDIFVTNNPTLRETVGELSLAGTKVRVQRWLDLRGNYPPAGSDEEYSFYAAGWEPTVADTNDTHCVLVSPINKITARAPCVSSQFASKI